ncbi:MAG: HEAT repeat domain-containing protein [Deltaproteobacteria bacterium]|nr:HEAT repeat domain-containing protein [Deltaproteobacteria bacterium]
MSLFPDRSPSAEAALRDLQSHRPTARRAAAEALADVDDPNLLPRAREGLIKATGDLRPDVRAAAAVSLGELGGDDAVDALISCLDDGNSEVRQVAAVALGTIGDNKAVPALIKALASDAPDLRFQAVTSLAEVDSDAAREPLLAILDRDDDAEVIAAAAIALGAIGEKRAADKLAAMIPDHGARVVFDLGYALADLGDPRAAEVLADYARSAELGWDAITALEKLGSPEAEAALRQALPENRGNPALPLRAAAALLRADPGEEVAGEARATLLGGLKARRIDHRGLTIELLGEVGGSWAVAPLEDLRRRWTSRRLRSEIDEALSHLRDSDS